MQNDEAGCLPLINSWITIWQSLIINLHTAHCAAPLCSPLAKSKLASRTTGKDIRLRALYSVHCATVLSLWEHFILLVWSASYILLTSEPAHCLTLHCSVCSIVDNCWLLLSRCCTRTRVKLLIAIVPLTWLNHWSGLQPVGHTFNHLSCCSLFKPVNNIECKNAIHRKTIIGGTLKFHKNSWQVLLNA